MRRIVLDTSILIGCWHSNRSKSKGELTPKAVQGWARQLTKDQGTDAIVTPVVVEMLCGVMGREQLVLTRAFLECFRVIDDGNIPKGDWEEAIRLAQRTPRRRRGVVDSGGRHLGDCLIRAIANRLRYEVETHDEGFPRGRG